MQEEILSSLREEETPYVTPELGEMFRALDPKPQPGIQLPNGTIREDH